MQEGESMRICIPTESDIGFDAKVHAHFGSAPIFTIFETDTEHLEIVNNPNNHVDAVVCGGMGARAVQKLNQGGIKAYLAKGDTVQEVLRQYDADDLEEITIQNSCVQHHCH
jgi:predicted Fe-Mo cluster-binding NifX family protein